MPSESPFPENHRKSNVTRDHTGPSGLTLLFKQGHPRVLCTGLQPGGTWICPGRLSILVFTPPHRKALPHVQVKFPVPQFLALLKSACLHPFGTLSSNTCRYWWDPPISAHLSSLSKALWDLWLIGDCSQLCWEGICPIIQITDEWIKEHWAQYSTSGDTTSKRPPNTSCATDRPSGTLLSSQFQIHLTVHLPSSHFLSLPTRLLWERVESLVKLGFANLLDAQWKNGLCKA